VIALAGRGFDRNCVYGRGRGCALSFCGCKPQGFVLPDGRYFLLVQKVTKNTLKGGCGGGAPAPLKRPFFGLLFFGRAKKSN